MVACLEIDDEFRADVRNNVFFLARGCDTFSSCIQNGAINRDTFDFDYNCYYVDSAGFVGDWRGTYVDFAGWQALGYDLHGLYGDPLFVDTSDLHLRQGSPCIGAGVLIAGFEFDIDGDPRDPAHPDIGADEFTGGGIEETMNDERGTMNVGPTILRRLPVGAVAFDAMGRRALNPKSGIYFVVSEPSAASCRPSAVIVRKVVIQR
jgi:hypothetical protein